MNESLISLSSIFLAIIAIVFYVKIAKKNYFSLTANILISVFGSVFFTKLFGALGIKPSLIFSQNELNTLLLIAYYLISIFGGIIAVVSVKKITNKYNIKN